MAGISSPHDSTPAELKERLEAERSGVPFLAFRDDDGRQHLAGLDPRRVVTVGRAAGADVRLEWDDEVSRAHAQIEWVAGDWAVSDDGLSRNGTFLNGTRIAGRQRLRNGDVLAIGRTQLRFFAPEGEETITRLSGDDPEVALSPAQRRVLVALCRPHGGGGAYASPATNQQIADELVLTIAAVKTHLRALFVKFGVADLPQNRKRTRLVELALSTGAVSVRELR